MFSKFKIEKSHYSTNTLFICYYNHFAKAALKDNRKRKLAYKNMKRNEIMAQVGASRLKLNRSNGKKGVSITL